MNDDHDLFTVPPIATANHTPLAARMRPKTLDEFVGQEHVLGEGKLLRRAIEADRVTSLVLFGPAGIGKTSLATVIAHATKSYSVSLNAVASNVEQVRKAIESARFRKQANGQRTIIFVDEIHRFNKAQQDVLMPGLEDGVFILIGATVHNPYFYINAPLLSRSLVCEFKPLSHANIRTLLERSLRDKERGFGDKSITCHNEALDFLIATCEGDARRALNALELAVLTTPPNAKDEIIISHDIAQESIQKKALRYDRNEDEHYDTISAFIKSMRGSDPDAAIYWMAKMLDAGDDPRFIARRICICAAEDVGNADPMALVLAQSTFHAVDLVGMPEARIPLAQAAIYVACAPKSNASYVAIEAASADIQENQTQPVPDYLKDASYRSAKKLGHGIDYKYAHDYDQHYVEQEYMIHHKTFYKPTDIGYEKKMKERLQALRKRPNHKGKS